VDADDPVLKAVAAMKRFEISQVPVVRNGIPIGSVCGASVIRLAPRGRLRRSLTVREVMEAPLPTVEQGGAILNRNGLLRDRGAAAAVRGAKAAGIITTIDVVNYLAKS